jgi:hypothetical protein
MEIDIFDDDAGEYVGTLYLSEELLDSLVTLAAQSGKNTDDFIIDILREYAIDRIQDLEDGSSV